MWRRRRGRSARGIGWRRRGSCAGRGGGEVDMESAVGRRSVRWLRRAEQLKELALAYERALTEIREHRKIARVHLFYAGPAPGAVGFGRAYNPRMNPEAVIYEYAR